MADPQRLASAVVNERVALKLKAYFDLAKEEIDKALSCEEWGLQDDAILFYQHALKMLIEAKGTRVPDAISSSEKSQVKSCQQKIAKWQAHLEDRLKLLGTTNKQKLAKWQADFEDKLKLLAQKTGTPPPPFTTTSKEKTSETERIVLPTNYNNNNNNTTNNTTNNNNNKDQGGVVNKIITGAVKLASSSTIAVAQDTLREMINATIVDRSPAVSWDDVAGLDKAKQALMEMVILPTKRRDLFTGLRKPAKGLLLFGPPGNGKPMLAKAVASESNANFFNVSASSLTSKWVGEGEKLVRTLFEAAVARQPSVIFIDEIDSVMSTRQAYEHDSSRRLKSEFLIQFDGVTSSQDALVIVIGATNKPQELDDAVLRRLVKRIYVPLPDATLRKILFKNQLKGQSNLLSGAYLERLVTETEGYSGSDMRALCEEAAMIPIRELGPQNILTIKVNHLRALKYEDFKKAMVVIRPSLQKSKWDDLEKWNKKFGSN